MENPSLSDDERMRKLIMFDNYIRIFHVQRRVPVGIWKGLKFLIDDEMDLRYYHDESDDGAGSD